MTLTTVNMKKLLLFLTMMVGTLTTYAADYTYLTFEMTDGAKTSVDVSALTLTISGTTLTAGSQSFTLSNLSKMYFSASDETTGIRQMPVNTLDEIIDVYDLQGRKIAKDQMTKGVYIVKTKQGTHKIVVK